MMQAICTLYADHRASKGDILLFKIESTICKRNLSCFLSNLMIIFIRCVKIFKAFLKDETVGLKLAHGP